MMRLKYFEFSDNDEQKIFNHFHRTTKMVAEDVQTIQEWMKVQPHLPEVLGNHELIEPSTYSFPYFRHQQHKELFDYKQM